MDFFSDKPYVPIHEQLKNLEARIARLEKELNLPPLERKKELEDELAQLATAAESAEQDVLEFQIGQYWFARAGILVLAIGIAFLLTFPWQGLPTILPSLFGYVVVGGIFLLAHVWRHSFAHLSRWLFGGALALLYFTTLRLHFFSDQAAIGSIPVEVLLLAVVSGVCLFLSLRRNSAHLLGLSIIMALGTGLVSDNLYALGIISILMAVLAVRVKLEREWDGAYTFTLVMTYAFNLVWFLNNPLLGRSIRRIWAPDIFPAFILVYILIFALAHFLRDEEDPRSEILLTQTFLNLAGGFGLILLVSVFNYSVIRFPLLHLGASLVFLGISIAFWEHQKSSWSTFFFAMSGYLALSLAIMVRFPMPELFVWLCWQSLLVVTTAVWFRSKFIIVANFVIYLLVLVAFLLLAGKVSAVTLSYGIVALVSARILNWQKDRLALKTEQMRNAYLAVAFFVFPYTLYHSVPSGYVSVSWSAVAILYYTMSFILSNAKYRWMGHLTLLLAVAYALSVDIRTLQPEYRIASFLILGMVLLVVSLLYNRSRSRRSADKAESDHPTGTGSSKTDSTAHSH